MKSTYLVVIYSQWQYNSEFCTHNECDGGIALEPIFKPIFNYYKFRGISFWAFTLIGSTVIARTILYIHRP